MTQPISRRTIAKAGVWSAPVVAASAAGVKVGKTPSEAANLMREIFAAK